jgi:ubiquinone/menaquinone biosynthesis C-methylase UbiE
MKYPYTVKAKLYDKYRWTYNEDVINWIISITKMTPNTLIAEYGVGTGKFTEKIARNCNKVFAIEPDTNMLNVLRNKHIDNVIPIEKSSHEKTEIPDHSIDIVIAAQALHWFDFNRTIIEFNRITKREHWLVNISNSITPNEALSKDEIELLSKYKNQIEKSSPNIKPIQYFDKKTIVEKYFPFILHESFDDFLGGLSSASYYPDENDIVSYIDFRKDVETLFNKHTIENKSSLQCKTMVQIGKLRTL